MPQARYVKARHGSAGERENTAQSPAGTAHVTSSTDNHSKIVDIRPMAHRYCNILIHCVFSTKGRKDLIPQELIPKLCKYFEGIGRNHGIPILAAGGVANHAHLLIALPPDVPIAKAVQVLKANSSRWLRERGLEFTWQEGYGAFSVSSSTRDAVEHYIEHQAEHHRKHSYEKEFETMLRKSGVTFDAMEAFG